MSLGKVEKNTVANYLGAGTSAFMGVAFIPIYISYLGAESFALVGLVALMQSWASLVDGGISAAVGRNISRYQRDDSQAPRIANLLVSCEFVFLGIAAVFVLLGVLVGTYGGSYWQEVNSIPRERLGLALFLIFLLTGFRVLEGFYRCALLAMERQITLNLWLICSATLKAFGSVIGLKFYSWDIVDFFLWHIFVTVGYCFILRLASLTSFFKKKSIGTWSFKTILESKNFMGGVVIINISALLLAQLDKLFLSGHLSLEQLGSYMFCATVASALNLLMYPVSQAFYPRFCDHYQHSEYTAFSNDFHKSSQIVTVISGSIVVWFIFFSQDILSLWTNDLPIARESSLIVVILLIGNYFSGVNLIPQHVQLAAGKTHIIKKTNLAMLVIYSPVMLFGFSGYGIIGVACSWLLIHVLYNLIIVTSIHKTILVGHWLPWLVRDNLFPMIVMFSIGWLVSSVLPLDDSYFRTILILAFSFLITLIAGILMAAKLRRLIFNF